MYKLTFDFPAGIRVRNKIENFIGIITSRIERINGARQYYIQPPRKEDGSNLKGEYSDFENLEIIDKLGIEIKKETIEFKFETGDFIRNKISGKEGYIVVRRVDLNNCIGYWFETGEQNPKTGDILEFYSFEPELELIHKGLNRPAKESKTEPIKRRDTGCVNIEAPSK